MTFINKFQKQIDVELPEEYVSWLNNYGGQVNINPGIFNVNVPHIQQSSIHHVFAFFTDPDLNYMDLEWNYDLAKNSLPSKFLPICDDGSGGWVVLALSKNDYGKIFYYDYYFDYPQGINYYNEKQKIIVDSKFLPLTIIANNFSEFINSLR